jgi:hypothetical protein
LTSLTACLCSLFNCPIFPYHIFINKAYSPGARILCLMTLTLHNFGSLSIYIAPLPLM